MGRVKGRVRINPVKGKRWGKGQSSSSNPDTNKHRLAAKGKFTNHLAQAGVPQAYVRPGEMVTLTTGALASHDAIQGDHEEEIELNSDIISNTAVEGEGKETEVEEEEDESEELGDTASLSITSASTAYTLIETAHPVFGKIKRLWNSPTESHREMCAVLAAVSEVIKTNGGEDTVTEYFGVLVTALESSEDEKSSTAVAYLLSIVMQKMPVEILQFRYGSVCKVLASKLSSYEMSDSTSLLKSLVHCLTILLGAQVSSIWNESHTQRVYQLLLNYTVHPKPKLRKVSQNGVVAMLKEGTMSGGFHPAARPTASHCLRILEGGNAETTVLHILGMLSDCLANMNPSHVKMLCDHILKLLSVGNSIIRSTAFKTLNGLFSSVAGPQGLTPRNNGNLISDLYSYQPSLVDAQLLNAWLTVMRASHMCLTHDLSLDLLPKLFTSAIGCLMADKAFVKKTAVSLMEGLLKKLSSGGLFETEEVQSGELEKRIVGLEKMFKAVESGLRYKYYSSWNHVLMVLATFYQVAGKNKKCQAFMTKSLMSLCELRDTDKFPYCDVLDSAFGAAIRAMGPRVVLEVVPLKFEEERKSHDFPRSWILPVLKEHVQATELQYFKDSMLPLATALGTKGRIYLEAGRPLEAKIYSSLQLQVWSLLPGFCTDPVDLHKAFTSDFARVLGTTLKDSGVQFQLLVCLALKQLISKSAKDEDRTRLARFSKNFLPILFSLYTTPASSSSEKNGERKGRSFILECIKAYFSITAHDLIELQFSKLVERMNDDKFSSIKHLLLDLAMAFAPHLSKSSLASLFCYISPLFDSGKVTLQKKAYGCLESILTGSNLDHQDFRRDHLTTLRTILVESLSTISAGSKKPRLRCLLLLTDQLSEENSSFISDIIPEVILCLKEVNEKVRMLAYKLVINLGYTAQSCWDQKPEDSIMKYFTLVLAGLAGSLHMISCTLLALSKLVYEFNDLLGTDLIKRLLSRTLVLLSSKKREVVRSTLVLIRVTIGVLPPNELAPHIEGMVKSILSWGENKRNHFRLKARAILERLVRRFDYEVVAGFVPKKHQKLMAHIRKTNERQKKNKQKRYESEEGGLSQVSRDRKHKPSYEELLDSSDDEDDEKRKVVVSKRKLVREKSKAWIKESPEDEPVNFMDPMVVKSVVATDPAKMKRARQIRSSKDTFERNKEGKLLITEEGEEKADLFQDHKDADAMDHEETQLGGHKRKRDFDDDEDDDDDTSKALSSGHGIHRTNARKHDFIKEYGSDYKAKKAKGDLKRKGQYDPYAYIPLNRQKLNKRKRAKMVGEFTGLMRKAKKGSAIGSKQRHKKKMT